MVESHLYRNNHPQGSIQSHHDDVKYRKMQDNLELDNLQEYSDTIYHPQEQLQDDNELEEIQIQISSEGGFEEREISVENIKNELKSLHSIVHTASKDRQEIDRTLLDKVLRNFQIFQNYSQAQISSLNLQNFTQIFQLIYQFNKSYRDRAAVQVAKLISLKLFNPQNFLSKQQIIVYLYDRLEGCDNQSALHFLKALRYVMKSRQMIHIFDESELYNALDKVIERFKNLQVAYYCFSIMSRIAFVMASENCKKNKIFSISQIAFLSILKIISNTSKYIRPQIKRANINIFNEVVFNLIDCTSIDLLKNKQFLNILSSTFTGEAIVLAEIFRSLVFKDKRKCQMVKILSYFPHFQAELLSILRLPNSQFIARYQGLLVLNKIGKFGTTSQQVKILKHQPMIKQLFDLFVGGQKSQSVSIANFFGQVLGKWTYRLFVRYIKSQRIIEGFLRCIRSKKEQEASMAIQSLKRIFVLEIRLLELDLIPQGWFLKKFAGFHTFSKLKHSDHPNIDVLRSLIVNFFKISRNLSLPQVK